MAMNKAVVHLIGQVGREPSLKFTKNGRPWIKFPIAVTERKKNDAGQWEDGKTDWYEIVAWSSLAESLADVIKKGDSLTVEGNLSREEWTGQDGATRVNFQVNATSIGVIPRFKKRQAFVANDRDFGRQPNGFDTDMAPF